MNIRGVNFRRYTFTLELYTKAFTARRRVTLWSVDLSTAYSTIKRMKPGWSVRTIALVPQLEPKGDTHATR